MFFNPDQRSRYMRGLPAYPEPCYTVEALMVGQRCNLNCGSVPGPDGKRASYCYEAGFRKAANGMSKDYDLDAIKAALKREGQPFVLFGGEALLAPIEDVEEMFRFGLAEFGEKAIKEGKSPNGLQTNGTLVTEAHLELFKKYKAHVGFSLDGPGKLNRTRWAGSLEKTDKATAVSLWAINECLERGISCSVICTLCKHNASPEQLPILLQWFRELAAKAAQTKTSTPFHVNLHSLEVDDENLRRDLVLSQDDAVAALLACGRLMSEIPIRFVPMTEFRDLLLGRDKILKEDGSESGGGVNCIWNACDAMTTAAVQGVGPDGCKGNCGRAAKDGVLWQKADRPGYERYPALYHTPQEYGGCKDCRFFFACKGSCPGEGEKNDVRGKTEHCGTLMRLFRSVEEALVAEGKEPLSLSPDRPFIERAQLAAWNAGQNPSIAYTLKRLREGKPILGIPEGTRLHGDSPHGNHTDTQNPVVTYGDGRTWELLK